MNYYLKSLVNRLSELKLNAFLVTNTVNVQYLTGFTGHDSFLLVTPQKSYLITDFRYITQAEGEIKDKDIAIVRHKNVIIKKTVEILNSSKFRTRNRVGFESQFISLATFKDFRNHLKKGFRFIPTVDVIESLRAIKTPEEIEKIRKSVKSAAEAFNKIRGFVKPGLSEKEIANQLDYLMKSAGAQGAAFTIVAIDERAALPHAPLSSKKTTSSCAILFDWGACVDEYYSDMTRVIFLGRISPKAKELYKIVAEAQAQAIALCKPGEVIQNVDLAARGYIRKKGYGKYFGHGLGHGIGRMVHELPRLRYTNKEILKPGMVVTIEPGIYLPGRIGIRLEDMILITENGCEVMTSGVPKELSQIMG
ncbi:MAG: Xaa-Pro peptidase family protein [Planctomycetota bacterium]|nr:Xaa-Pro peptidase family protein [Planctomycetota bacterium]MDI6787256.1 Xaa-Pro peptidase family protein [Planctomycetota bacterium]